MKSTACPQSVKQICVNTKFWSLWLSPDSESNHILQLQKQTFDPSEVTSLFPVMGRLNRTSCASGLQIFISHIVKFSAHTLSMREIWSSNPGSVKSTQCRQRLATTATFLRSCVACSPGYKLRRWTPPLVTRFGVIPRV